MWPGIELNVATKPSIIHHNLCWRSTPISVPEINQDSLHVTTRYMEKDKWSQTVKAFPIIYWSSR
jgi:hypothetical protein